MGLHRASDQSASKRKAFSLVHDYCKHLICSWAGHSARKSQYDHTAAYLQKYLAIPLQILCRVNLYQAHCTSMAHLLMNPRTDGTTVR